MSEAHQEGSGSCFSYRLKHKLDFHLRALTGGAVSLTFTTHTGIKEMLNMLSAVVQTRRINKLQQFVLKGQNTFLQREPVKSQTNMKRGRVRRSALRKC